MKQVKARVTSVLEVMPETHLLWLEAPEIVATARPGQFVMVRCEEDVYLPRPFSLHRTDGENLALLFNIVGKGTGWLSRRKNGDILDIFGPLGNGFTINPDSKNLLLVAGGIGIAPLVFLADEAVKQGNNVILFMGARNAACLLPGKLLPTGVKTACTTEDGSAGLKGMITACWADLRLKIKESGDCQDIYACGPVGMYRTMAEMPELKNKSVQVSLEIMMGCGSGVCYGCTIKTRSGLKQVCRDGPVFALAELDGINWDELIL